MRDGILVLMRANVGFPQIIISFFGLMHFGESFPNRSRSGKMRQSELAHAAQGQEDGKRPRSPAA